MKPTARKLHNEEKGSSLLCVAIRVDPTASKNPVCSSCWSGCNQIIRELHKLRRVIQSAIHQESFRISSEQLCLCLLMKLNLKAGWKQLAAASWAIRACNNALVHRRLQRNRWVARAFV